MKLVFLASLLAVVPFITQAQLSSENFQVDSYSVGGGQSFRGSSENFQVSQETGGLYQQGTTNGSAQTGSQAIGGFASESFADDETETSTSTSNPSVPLGKTMESETSSNAQPGTGTDVSSQNKSGYEDVINTSSSATSGLSNIVSEESTGDAADFMRPSVRMVERSTADIEYIKYFAGSVFLLLLFVAWLLYRRFR